MRRSMVGAVLAGLLGLAPGAHAAGSDPARAEESRAPSEARAPEQATLLLSIRARALGLIQDTAPDDGLEPMRAPTGEGRSQMPSATTEIARGVYLTVMPACLPGVDEPLLPSPYGRRTVPPSRRR